MQYHLPKVAKDAIVPLNTAAAKTVSYDGYAEFLVRNVSAFQAAFTDPFYAATVAPDEAYLFDLVGSVFGLGSGYRQVHFKSDEEWRGNFKY